MDQRRFRSLGVAGVLLFTLVLNGRSLLAAFSGNYSTEYVLLRYVAALSVGYVGMRIMDAILFRAPALRRGHDPAGATPKAVGANRHNGTPTGVTDAEEVVG